MSLLRVMAAAVLIGLGACTASDGATPTPPASAPPSSSTPPPAPAPTPAPTPSGSLITLDPTLQYQTLTGWETTPRTWEQDKVNNRYDGSWLNYRDEIMDSLVNEAGINRIRLEGFSGMESDVDCWGLFTSGVDSYTDFRACRYRKINDNADPNSLNAAGFHFGFLDYQVENFVRPMQTRLAARGETLFINFNFIDFRPPASSGNMDHAEAPEEYAEFIQAVFDHLKSKYNITPDALEIILEPDNTDNWRGAQIGRAIVAAANRLEAAGYTPQIIAPSTKDAGAVRTYADAALAVSGAGARLTTLAYHSYDFPTDNLRQTIFSYADQRGLRTAMLEKGGAGISEFYSDVTQANVSAWQQWSTAFPDDDPDADTGGWNYLLVTLNGTPGSRVRLARKTRKLAEVWRHARLGATRIEAKSNDASLRPLAFINANGKYSVSLIADKGGDFTINGLPAGTYGVEYTTDSELSARRSDITIAENSPLVSNIPAGGVVTVYQK